MITEPTPWMLLPFVMLLALMALAPLFFSALWARYYIHITLGLAGVTILYYLVGLHATGRILATGGDYLRFITLIGSLYIVAGGIHCDVKGEATPSRNVLFLLTGAMVSNVLGTTGASMLFIRPWLRMNKYRVTAHHVVFFIFIVSNVGGALTPVGDPPLYLGFLKGVPFWWVLQRCWEVWATAVGILLLLFYAIDRRNYLRAPRRVREELAEPPDTFKISGLPNLLLLGVIFGSTFVENPPFLREFLMVAAAVLSWRLTPRRVHEANEFSLHPVKEVAILFVGIFGTMMPAMDWLQTDAATLGAPTPGLFYFSSGLLSSLLDNAPTYLTFLSALFGSVVPQSSIDQLLAWLHQNSTLAAAGAVPPPELAGAVQFLRTHFAQAVGSGTTTHDMLRVSWILSDPGLSRFIMAISAGSVFFGANTYIGNGPNLMVKAIADQQRVHTPSFLGYVVRFTLPCMAPMLLIIWWLFFRS